MMQDFRNDVKQFLTSEVGQATVRGPLALGVASGALLLSQVVHTSSAHNNFQCFTDNDCSSGYECEWRCEQGAQGTCAYVHTRCVPKGS